MDRREHHRAQLRLPVRLRWNTPFGPKTEITRTLDVSRGGLRAHCESAHAQGVKLWVTFPYDDSLGEGQPEVLARVTRSEPSENGNGNRVGSQGEQTSIIGLSFQSKLQLSGNGKRNTPQRERRGSARHAIAFLIRVRPQGIPLFEEAMTADVSGCGVRFVSNREYQPGDVLFVSSDSAVAPQWLTEIEIVFRVMRVEAIPETTTMAVALARMEMPLRNAGIRADVRI